MDWLKNYKTSDGKPPNVLEQEAPTTQSEAVAIIEKTHSAWKTLMSARDTKHDFWLQQAQPAQ